MEPDPRASAKPVVSVVITCDFASGRSETWNDLRAVLAALARQDFAEPAEFLLVETAALAPAVPEDLAAILPSLRLIVSPATTAATLKNEGVRAASAELIAMIDGDCIPVPGWLRDFVALMRARPEILAVSGRTRYKTRRFFDRAMALVTRSYLDAGRTAETRHLTDNNCGFRRSMFLSRPFSDNAGPHMSMLYSEALLRSGGRLFFDPRLCVEHSYRGWTTEKEIRRSMGYGVIRARRLDSRLPYAHLARLGYFSIPLFVAARTLHTWRNCVRCARWYGVPWYALPVTLALATAACAMEITGMAYALRDRPLTKTSYR